MSKLIILISIALSVCFVTDLMAPETTERDVFGFESYRVKENGSICDKDGTIRGWVTENIVYDAHWNIRYHIHGDKLCKAKEDRKG